MNPETKILKTSSRFWWQIIGTVVLLFIIMPIAMILYYGTKMYIASGFLVLMGMLILILEIPEARKQKITFSDLQLIVNTSKGEFKQSWETIKAVKLVWRGKARFLILYCDEHILNIPIRFFDETALMERLKEHLSPSVFESQAYQRLFQFVEGQDDILKKVSNLDRPLKVSLGRFEKWIGFLSVGLGVLFTVSSFFSDRKSAVALILLGLLFGGLGLLLFLFCVGWLEADNTSISIRTIFRKFVFSWSELREIYFNSARGILALVGENSKLLVPNPSGWSGKDKALLLDLLKAKITMSKLEIVESSKVLYWWSKNA